MHIPEIIEVKEHLEALKKKEIIKDWELPYENLLTRRSAAIFFLTPKDDNEPSLKMIWKELGKYENFSSRLNVEKKLSDLMFRVTFSKEEKEKALSNANETKSP
ncbi:MAG: hypothetical protein MI921_02925 [Cytophagales bacterium]|nr:hypothetical protein [Cytophagales bacterium]